MLSNEGCKNQFDIFLETLIYPILIELSKCGERECHLIILNSEDSIEWDEEYPPQINEQESKSNFLATQLTKWVIGKKNIIFCSVVLFNTQLCKFFKYVENRDIAKQVLKDRGLKKIRLGIEGLLRLFVAKFFFFF